MSPDSIGVSKGSHPGHQCSQPMLRERSDGDNMGSQCVIVTAGLVQTAVGWLSSQVSESAESMLGE